MHDPLDKENVLKENLIAYFINRITIIKLISIIFCLFLFHIIYYLFLIIIFNGQQSAQNPKPSGVCLFIYNYIFWFSFF